MNTGELNAKLKDVETELKRTYATRDKNTSKRGELRKLKSRILNYLSRGEGFKSAFQHKILKAKL